MKFKKILLLPSLFSAAVIVPIVTLSSCSSVGPDDPIRLSTSVFESGNKSAFYDIYNLLYDQNHENSFIKKDTGQINASIQKGINENKLIQEKLRIYFFNSIYNSLKSVYDIINGELMAMELVGERSTAITAIQTFISDSENEHNNFKSIEDELLKIIDIKLTLSLKVPNEPLSGWIWEIEFKLDAGSRLAEIIQGNNNLNNKRGVFYKRGNLTSEEKDKASREAVVISEEPVNSTKWRIEYDKLILQAEYQSSKWYWDNDTKILKSIKLESNINPYSSDGTSGGFTLEDGMRTLFGIDFEQDSRDITLYNPVFLFKSSKTISMAYSINSQWNDFLIYKKYLDKDDIEADEEKIKDIKIDLNSSKIKYEKRI